MRTIGGAEHAYMQQATDHNLLVLFLTTAYTVTMGAVWLWTCWM
jgi:hypothetical protein